jgi:transposase
MTETATEYVEEYVEYEEGEYTEEAEVEYEDKPGAELAVVEAGTEVVEAAPLTERQAKALDKKIRATNDKMNTTAENLFDLLEQAAMGRIHEALGYASWTAWFSEAVQLRPQDREQRKALVAMMTGKGMSQRAAAKALGVSQKTVDRDLEGTESHDSDTVTSLDGSQRARTRKKVIDAEIVSVEEDQRTAADVVQDFSNEIDTLLINVQAFKDVLDDELFDKARKRIAQRFVKRLNGAINDLTKVMEEVTA